MRTVTIGPVALRVKFNGARVAQRAADGQLLEKLVADRHPSRTAAREPFCTRSQVVAYYAPDGRYVAHAHRYLRKDGTLGASGRPDPKRFVEGDTLYIVVEPAPKPARGRTKGPTR